jgi:hypothetical protein
MSKIPLQLQINGETHDLLVKQHWSLLHCRRQQAVPIENKNNRSGVAWLVCTSLFDGRR